MTTPGARNPPTLEEVAARLEEFEAQLRAQLLAPVPSRTILLFLPLLYYTTPPYGYYYYAPYGRCVPTP